MHRKPFKGKNKYNCKKAELKWWFCVEMTYETSHIITI